MVDWTGDASLVNQGAILSKLDLILFGIFLWECIVTLKFDIDVVTRKRPHKWPVLAYWLTKYSTLAFIIGVNIIDGAAGFLVTDHFIHCQATQYVITVSARCAMAGASGLLMLRAIALWERDYRVAIPLVVLHLGQWGFYLYNALTIPEAWSEELQRCYTPQITLGWLKAQFIYTMGFDGVVLFAAFWALARLPGRTSLWKALFLDGLVYYVATFLMYLACTLVAHLNPSPYLMFISSDLATVGVSILACRSFVRIAKCFHADNVAEEESANSSTGIMSPNPPSPTLGKRLRGHWRISFNTSQNTDVGRSKARGMAERGSATFLEMATAAPSIAGSDLSKEA